MKLVNRFYNEERFRREVEELLNIVSKDESQVWLKHPCTKALINLIQADMCAVIDSWIDGSYSKEESVDITAQRTANAQGLIQSMDYLLGNIEQIGSGILEENL